MSPDTEKAPRPGGDRGALTSSSLGGVDLQANKPRRARTQVKNHGGRASRHKGDRFERALARLLQDHGLGAERVPLSGSAGGSYSGDLTCPVLGVDRTVECKSRKDGFRELYSWLQARDLLVIKADRRDALVVLPLRLAAEIAIAAAERRKP
jgi:Holliday junction resolvase